ncbi:MAG: FAD binding domain-containing protein [Oscillospiraceae bacterium]|nr:FAD binding domain-containing protein [Oscillospiraceae bacterium]
MIYKPTSVREAVALRTEHPEDTVYLAGGTDDLRLGSCAAGKDLIDINGLVDSTIDVKDGKLHIGALATLQDVVESPLVPAFIKEAAKFCSSFEKRNAATVGGNLALRRDDSYLAAAMCAAEATLLLYTSEGETERPVAEFLKCTCTPIIEAVVLDADRTGWVKRFGNTAASHAALIAAQSGGVYALTVHGSGLAVGDSPAICETLDYKDDLTGGADYKKYLAKIVFEQGR